MHIQNTANASLVQSNEASNSQNTTDTLSARLGELLSKQGLSVSCAESCTGGGIAYAITSVAGSSVWFNQSWVTYSNAAKHTLLGVPLQLLDNYGAVSEQTARAMLAGVLANSGAKVAVSVTGIAGPGGGSEHKPVGLVWFGFAINDAIYSHAETFTGDRAQIRSQAIDFALNFLIEGLVEQVNNPQA